MDPTCLPGHSRLGLGMNHGHAGIFVPPQQTVGGCVQMPARGVVFPGMMPDANNLGGNTTNHLANTRDRFSARGCLRKQNTVQCTRYCPLFYSPSYSLHKTSHPPICFDVGVLVLFTKPEKRH